MTKPLRYKLIVTKKRIHVAHAVIYAFLFTGILVIFLFFRKKDFTFSEDCITIFILQDTTFVMTYSIFALAFVIMFFNYIILTVKLQQRQVLLETRSTTSEFNSKMTRVSLVSSLRTVSHCPTYFQICHKIIRRLSH